MCDYELSPGEKCHLEQYGSSPFCILHTPFPDDKTDIEYQNLLEMKNNLIQEKIKAKDFNFTGAYIQDLIIPEGSEIKTSILFDKTRINGVVWFSAAIISGGISFNAAIIEGKVGFPFATIDGSVYFSNAKINDVSFVGAKINGDLLFDNVLSREGAGFAGAEIKGRVVFDKTIIGGLAWFNGLVVEGDDFSFKAVEIKEDALFEGVTIYSSASFEDVIIGGNAEFSGLKIGQENAEFKGLKLKYKLSFDNCSINGNAIYYKALINGPISFIGANIDGNASFVGAWINGDASFDLVNIEGILSFWDATINGHASFDGASIQNELILDITTIQGNITFFESVYGYDNHGDISLLNPRLIGNFYFDKSFFKNLKAREKINRFAKKICEGRGEKHDADNYFFEEMVARRQQKEWGETATMPIRERLINYGKYWLEWPLENLFFYGVHPEYSFLIWILIIGLFTVIYWIGNMVDTTNFSGFLYFSLTNAMTPGYGGMNPKLGLPQYIATLEAIFGTFMWASFITILARKFSR